MRWDSHLIQDQGYIRKLFASGFKELFHVFFQSGTLRKGANDKLFLQISTVITLIYSKTIDFININTYERKTACSWRPSNTWRRGCWDLNKASISLGRDRSLVLWLWLHRLLLLLKRLRRSLPTANDFHHQWLIQGFKLFTVHNVVEVGLFDDELETKLFDEIKTKLGCTF